MPKRTLDGSTPKQIALSAHRKAHPDAIELLERALLENPFDGQLLIAHATASAHNGIDEPFEKIEGVLEQAPDWIDGHKELGRLKIEMGCQNPFASIEAAIERLPQHSRLWMAYLSLLGSADRHLEAADHAADLRQSISDIPALRLLEARYAGLAGHARRAENLLSNLPSDIPDVHFERARNKLRLGELDQAKNDLDKCLSENSADVGAWALAELCWRAIGDPMHDWLLQGGVLYDQMALGLSPEELHRICEVIAGLHFSKAAPLGQSVKGGTQTRGDLRDFAETEIVQLFGAIEERISDFANQLANLPNNHPMASLRTRQPKIVTAWSIRLTGGGHHVSHLHNNGLVSSAAHLRLPQSMGPEGGLLELGRPPQDIQMELSPLATYQPEAGHLVLFPSFLYHGTTPFREGERLSVAFDVA